MTDAILEWKPNKNKSLLKSFLNWLGKGISNSEILESRIRECESQLLMEKEKLRQVEMTAAVLLDSLNQMEASVREWRLYDKD